MSLDIGIDPNTTSLLTAIGITDDDGQLIASWFDHPLTAIRRILANPTQRNALLHLLDELLPPDPDLPGWYPLLDTEVGNLYLTVENDIVASTCLCSQLSRSPRRRRCSAERRVRVGRR